jgi:ADP-ribose pyrophosphatase YjhB (NUDIX family)
MHRIRSSAAIVRDEHILLVAFDDPAVGLHYNLPGGGVEAGEAVHEALRREIREETGAEIEIGPLVLVWQFRPGAAGLADGPPDSIGLIFRAELRPGSEPRLPDAPDPWQIGVEWAPLDELPNLPLLPRMAGRLVEALRGASGNVFVGDVA